MHLGLLSPQEQEVLCQQVLAGDKEARDRLADLLLRFLRKVIRAGDDDVDDVIQEQTIRILDELKQQDPAKGALHAWCYVRVRDAVRFARFAQWREAKRLPSYDDRPEHEKLYLGDLSYEDRTVEQREAHRIVHNALKRLDPVSHAVLRLELEGYSEREIARAFAVPQTRAVELLTAAKQQMAAVIQP